MSDNIVNFPEKFFETPREAWDRACKFMIDNIGDSLVLADMTDIAKDIRNYPLPPYLVPGMEEVS